MSARNPRAQELLADDALVGLTAEEHAELEQMLVDSPLELDGERDALARAAASVAIASTSKTSEEIPASLIAKLEKLATSTSTSTSTPARVPSAIPLPVRSRLVGRIGWIAAAAGMLIAIGSWTREPREVVVTKSVFVPHDVLPPPPPTPEEERERLLAKAGTEKIDWSAAKDDASKDASGDVVWNAAEQKGAMRFRGLAKNDPKKLQYQLWIFDKTRDDKYPVDGGVFDVDAKTGDVIVPITARVAVREATLFAVTVEKPGGAVVSKRERIILTAKTRG